jgi:hypothetical protein
VKYLSAVNSLFPSLIAVRKSIFSPLSRTLLMWLIKVSWTPLLTCFFFFFICFSSYFSCFFPTFV